MNQKRKGHYELYFPAIGFFRFDVNAEQFDEVIKGILWGILRDFEATDHVGDYFTRGETLVWKITMYYSRWYVPIARLKDLYAEYVIDDERVPIKIAGITNPYKKKKDKA